MTIWLAAAAVWVGSQACQPCHSGISAAYAKTSMAQSSGLATQLQPAAFQAGGHRYRISNHTLHFDSGSASVDYFLGSGRTGRTYLHKQDRFLFELPVTWFAREGKWKPSPGYEHDSEVDLTRAIDPTCLSCHASRIRPIYGTRNRYADPPFLDNGVSCERCHGPGGEHVRNPAANRMVNPVKLDAERRDSVCMQCHLTGGARVERPGKKFAQFRAGDRVGDFATYFSSSKSRDNLKIVSHFERLTMSACKRASGDALWCGSCHQPHTNANKTQQACIGCHAQAHMNQELAKQNCASCHMPKANASDVTHGVVTDHRIVRLPADANNKATGNSIAVLAGPADDRSMGLAYAEMGDARAKEFLLRSKATDSAVLFRLATLESDPNRSAELYRQSVAQGPVRLEALVNLGVLLAQAGDYEAAGSLWRRALAMNPATEAAALNLAKISPVQEAKAVLLRYLEFNPASKAAQK